ncbi:MAG: 1-deoxy-D-xylulose-5-phosphate synthase [Deltaproteobacteria bacterium CG_4_8_14_3_um_filter_45_9]|nr:MAG: 1-deoxy-D-xylulose-5-phosphate synthase [Deltaproteobacteria bacterium CG03_land_8_20_14_0_80_45_14]PIX25744.1 MAG: 1-deoxy-D-xylulose-5-phosphate synthase [Deltaproteobacteria bacterium CG_4_8_14_3_um_filter_45_9]
MTKVLDQIQTSHDVKKLDSEELERLCYEIREEILSTVSKNGGHLASNLGVVELTTALHYVFDFPRDKLVWDVGHQSYAHKLLTGRKDRFHTLRQYEGISGFPKRDESVYDAFDSGHSGTSISSALGMAEARRLKGEEGRVIAVIGDGSMTAGLAFEGLNQAGHINQDLIVILNDNEMSISRNVGALSSYLNRLMTGQFVNRFRDEMKGFLETLPGIGKSVLRFAKQAEESLKGFFMPGLLFEELGMQYIGPIDGHRLDYLIETFQNIKKLRGPILVHVITKKGKGYPPAEMNPDRFHGVPPFVIETGELRSDSSKKLPTYTEVFGETLCQLAIENKRLIAITAAMQNGTGLEEFARKFPDRFYDIGIAEQHAVTFAAGLALEGMKPVVAIYSTFLQRAYDQVLQDVCLQNLPVVFALDRGGIVGEDGPTHHGLFDFSYLRHIPNLIVMVPKDENEFQHMIKTATECPTPVAFRYQRGKGVGVKKESALQSIDIGKGEILREGEDILIIALGSTVYPSLRAAEKLADVGVQAAVINSRFLKPLDGNLLCDWAQRTGKILTVEENVLQGGFGSAVLELFQERSLFSIQVKRLGIPDTFVEHGPQTLLREKYGIDENGIFKGVKEMLGERRSELIHQSLSKTSVSRAHPNPK